MGAWTAYLQQLAIWTPAFLPDFSIRKLFGTHLLDRLVIGCSDLILMPSRFAYL
jgi:hypothetical protein